MFYRKRIEQLEYTIVNLKCEVSQLTERYWDLLERINVVVEEIPSVSRKYVPKKHV